MVIIQLTVFRPFLTTSLVVDSAAALNAFPKGSSLVASRLILRAQHLIVAISGNISPDAQLGFEHLTRLVSKFLSGALHIDIAPWLMVLL